MAGGDQRRRPVGRAVSSWPKPRDGRHFSLHPFFDWRLVPYDLAALGARHRVGQAGFLSASDLAAVESALTEISEEFDSGDLHPSATDEDVHGALERILIEKVGPQAGEHSVLAGAATIRLPHSSGSTCAIARNS